MTDTRFWLVIGATAAVFALWLAAKLACTCGRSHARIAGARRGRGCLTDALGFAGTGLFR